MANPIVQRLIAAGASPARANAFATQFTASQPGLKTQDLEDAFDDQLAELSKVYFPNAFRPPTIDDPRFDDYVEFLSPGALKRIETQILAKSAPAYNKALNSPVAYEKKLAEAVKKGFTLPQIQQAILNDFNNNDPALLEFPIVKTTAYDPATTADVVEGINSYANKLYDDYLKVAPALVEAKKTFVTADKTFAAGLPSPKLKYGEKEDMKQGIISWKTSLKGEKALKDPKVSQAKAVAQTAPSSYMVDPKNPKASITAFDKLRGDATNVEKDLFKQFMTQKKIPTPLKDEISRREYLKDKTKR
jgi:hypothetical protein